MNTTNHIIDHQPESQQPRGFNPLLDINFEQRRTDIRDRWNGSDIGTKALELVDLMEVAHGFWDGFMRKPPNTEPLASTINEQEQMQLNEYYRSPYYGWAYDAANSLHHGHYNAYQHFEFAYADSLEDAARRCAQPIKPNEQIKDKHINALFAMIAFDYAYTSLLRYEDDQLDVFEREKGEGLALLEKCKVQQRGEALVEKARDETTKQIATKTSKKMGEIGRQNLGNRCAAKYSLEQKIKWWNDLKAYLDKHDPDNKLRKKNEAAKHVANAWLKENPNEISPYETIRKLTNGPNWRDKEPKK